MSLPRLLVLTDRSQLPLGRSLLSTLLEAADAGATAIVVRELDLPDAQRAALAEPLVERGVTVIAAHRAFPGARGVHLPAACNAELPPLPSRSNASAATVTPRYSWVVGRSCHTPEEVRRAAADGAGYATLSPFAETPSKPGYGPALPRGAYAELPIPAYALAGITPENAAAARDAGAHGVAVMGAVMRSADPGATVARLLEAVAG
jgi:thiamine-phosphate pyrophosphorylase